MPSQLHETLVELFRNRPMLAPELLRDALHFELPPFAEARVHSAELADLHPADRRADLVVQLEAEAPALGIVLEVQLRRDVDKRFAWPAYVCNLRVRLRCPVYLLVVTASEVIARWAAAMAAQQASLDLDAPRSRLYFDLIQVSLGGAARREFLNMDPAKYEYQSEFARRYVSQGKEEGKVEGKVEGKLEGKAELLARLLLLRFGPLGESDRAVVANATVEELDAIGERLLVAKSLDEALRSA